MDILDEDLDLGYVPSTLGMRSTSMKKLAKKESKKEIKPKQKEDFGDLLDDLIDERPKNIKTDSLQQVGSFNSFLDEAPNSNFALTTKMPDAKKQSNFGRISILKNESQDEPIVQDTFLPYNKTQLSMPPKEESFISTRSMKPPLKKRDSIMAPSLVIPEETSSNFETDTKLPRFASRRSSIEQLDQGDNLKKDEFLETKREPPKERRVEIPFQESISFDRQYPAKDTVKENKDRQKDHEREVARLKDNYERQITSLQNSLQKQMSANQETRERVTGECTRMMDEERVRTKRNHEEELARVKQLHEWERSRLEESYKEQIRCLKQSLQHLSLSAQKQSSQPPDRSEHELRAQKKQLQDREQLLNRRDTELAIRESDWTSRKAREQERLYAQEKRLAELEMRFKRSSLEDRQSVGSEKQQIAFDMAKMELALARKQEKVDFALRELEIEKEAVEKEKVAARTLGKELMDNYKDKMEQMHCEKQRVQELQMELLRKLRTIDLKAKEVGVDHKNGPQIDNWTSKNRGNSAEKTSFNKTQQRFFQVQKEVAKQRKDAKFDLQKYVAI